MALYAIRRSKQATDKVFQLQEESSQLAQYELNHEDFEFKRITIGDGTYGSVEKAYHHLLGDVAVKFSFRESENKFIRTELTLLTSVSSMHPNLVRAFGLVQRPGITQLGLVMELMDGGDLNKLIFDRGLVYNVSHAVHYMRQVSAAICHLHNANIIHRDVKPHNILLCERLMTAKLCDFGLVRKEQAFMSPNQGSPFWLAPECFTETYDRKTDVYAMAIVLWQLLSRRRNFRVALSEDANLRPEKIDCDPQLWHIIEKGWLTDRAERFSALDFYNELVAASKIFVPSTSPQKISAPPSPDSSQGTDTAQDDENSLSLCTIDPVFTTDDEATLPNIVDNVKCILDKGYINIQVTSRDASTQTADPPAPEVTSIVCQDPHGVFELCLVKPDPNLEDSYKDDIMEVESWSSNGDNDFENSKLCDSRKSMSYSMSGDAGYSTRTDTGTSQNNVNDEKSAEEACSEFVTETAEQGTETETPQTSCAETQTDDVEYPENSDLSRSTRSTTSEIFSFESKKKKTSEYNLREGTLPSPTSALNNLFFDCVDGDDVYDLLQTIRSSIEEMTDNWAKKWFECQQANLLRALEGLTVLLKSAASCISTSAANIYVDAYKKDKTSLERFRAVHLLCQHHHSLEQPISKIIQLLKREIRVIEAQHSLMLNVEVQATKKDLIKLYEKISGEVYVPEVVVDHF